jgi:hypothetical protein
VPWLVVAGGAEEDAAAAVCQPAPVDAFSAVWPLAAAVTDPTITATIASRLTFHE